MNRFRARPPGRTGLSRLAPSRLVPATLTGRLVATLVAVLVVSTALVAAVTTYAMRSYLTDRLDQQLTESLGRAVDLTLHGVPPTAPDGPTDRRGDSGREEDQPPNRFERGQRPGTLTVVYDQTGSIAGVVGSSGMHGIKRSTVRAVRQVPADGQAHRVELPELGSYQVQAAALRGGVVAVGLPMSEVTGTVTKLLFWEAMLGLVAVAVAALLGQALVRRQLQPLHQVAATAHEVAGLPLSSGEIGETVRVPPGLTDPRTEVGQVGAALNTMLAHVEDALDARHRSEQQVRQFVADASHELRTPLSTIQGYAELSHRSGSAADLGQAMGKVESEARRMSRLVEDLLLLARLDAGRPLERHEVDVTKLVLEAVDDTRVVDGGERRWLLELPDEPLLLTGDEQRLHQVLTNLLNNARRHTPAGTTVTVAAQATPDLIVLTVHDDGPGLSPQLQGSAFERFTRGDSSRTRASGGAGLGLSLVHAITTAHGGSVSVSSRPGDTTFTVRLPR